MANTQSTTYAELLRRLSITELRRQIIATQTNAISMSLAPQIREVSHQKALLAVAEWSRRYGPSGGTLMPASTTPATVTDILAQVARKTTYCYERFLRTPDPENRQRWGTAYVRLVEMREHLQAVELDAGYTLAVLTNATAGTSATPASLAQAAPALLRACRDAEMYLSFQQTEIFDDDIRRRHLARLREAINAALNVTPAVEEW